MQDKVMPFPLVCMTTPKTFVLCKKNRSYCQQQAAWIRVDKSWRYFELDTYHDCMWEDPDGLVKILAGE